MLDSGLLWYLVQQEEEQKKAEMEEKAVLLNSLIANYEGKSEDEIPANDLYTIQELCAELGVSVQWALESNENCVYL